MSNDNLPEILRAPEGQPLRIVIGQAGWVWIGYFSQVGSEVTLRQAACIRRWGTSAGLGELAIKGPQPQTILDPVGIVRIHELAIVGTYDVIQEKFVSPLDTSMHSAFEEPKA